jgi:hypothetical protein
LPYFLSRFSFKAIGLIPFPHYFHLNFPPWGTDPSGLHSPEQRTGPGNGGLHGLLQKVGMDVEGYSYGSMANALWSTFKEAPGASMTDA